MFLKNATAKDLADGNDEAEESLARSCIEGTAKHNMRLGRGGRKSWSVNSSGLGVHEDAGKEVP